MATPTWSTTPANAETDKALRRAAAVSVMGWKVGEAPGAERTPMDSSHGGAPRPQFVWLFDWNRDDLARVFAAAQSRSGKENTGPFFWKGFDLWADAIDDPRAALCALLDLLGVPVPPEVNQ